MTKTSFAFAGLAAALIAAAGYAATSSTTTTSTNVVVVGTAPTVASATQASTGTTAVASPTTTSSTTTAPKPSTYIKSVYVGNYRADFTAYEQWLGRQSGGVQLHTGRANWTDWSSSIAWLIGLWSSVDRTIFWTIPLITQGASLDDGARGKFNAYYVAAARKLAAGFPNTKKIYIRTGWEFNGSWQPWAARGKEAAYRGAFRQFVTSFRSVSSRFVFEWAPNVGDVGMNPETAYPGDDVVDIIGMDVYYNHDWDAADAAKAFAYHRDEKYGLAWHQAFAKLHGKPTAYAEWGISRNTDVAFVQMAQQWFASHNIVYASYWNSNESYRGKLSDNQYPAVSAAYRKLVAN